MIYKIKNIHLAVLIYSLFTFIYKSSSLPFEEFFKCYVTHDVCPNENITFYLYTRETRYKPMKLNVFDKMTMIKQELFIKNVPIIVLIHGFTGHKDLPSNIEIRSAYFDYGDYNIISIDYQPLALEPCYIQAVHNLPVVAHCTAELLNFLVYKNVCKLNDIHVIGFSLGAQTAGMISNYINGKLERITGLDPAKPLFMFANSLRKLEKSDAKYVDVIHTDILQRGISAPIGHADFYVNGGIQQPGCNSQMETTTGSCNHLRAPQYYAESIGSTNGFWGFKCNRWLNLIVGKCKINNSNELALMGMHATNKTTGLYFVDVNAERPFAQGIPGQ